MNGDRFISLTSDPDENPRVRALEDGAGWAHEVAEAKVTGTGYLGQRAAEISVAAPRSRRHYRNRLPYADGDSGLDPHWNVEPESLSPEQMETNRRGLELSRSVISVQRDPTLSSEEKRQRVNELIDKRDVELHGKTGTI